MPDAALVALNRFGLGARVGERGRLTDPRGWLRTQLSTGVPTLSSPDIPEPRAIGDALRALRAAGRDLDAKQEARRRVAAIVAADAHATLTARVTSERPFVERLVAFWSNHLCISAGSKVVVGPLAGSYEREAIRPHVLGRFEDMVLASAHHPAMLLYLDNNQSIGPGSPGARRARDRGLNENYARELMELHTLGVDGGYTQRDVQELAKILTGWTVDGLTDRRAAPPVRPPRRLTVLSPPPDGTIRFVFRDALHEPGSKTLLGTRYRDAGAEEGERAIRALCRHRSTSRFVARKLVAHFAVDDPPAAAVDHVATVFHDTTGDLRAVTTALIDLPAAWDGASRKFRTPQDWLVAMLRATGAAGASPQMAAQMRQLRHPLWSPAAPNGFGDSLREWADPDSLLNRGELARTIARRLRADAPDARTLLDVMDVAPADPLRIIVADTTIANADRVALACAGPAFQWR